jgi:hypothetical protein
MSVEADLWGGTLVPKQEALALALAIRRERKLDPDLSAFLTKCFQSSTQKQALVWRSDANIAGTWHMDANQRWI